MTGPALAGEQDAPMTEEEMIAAADPGIIEVQGRRFIVQSKTTGRQDMYIMALLEQSNFEKLRDQMDEDGELSDLAVRLVAEAYKQDTLFDIIGGLLCELDAKDEPLVLYDDRGRRQRWTKEKAEEIGNFVANLDEPSDKEKFHALMTSILVLFFTTGAASWTASPSSSQAAPQVQVESSATPRPDGSSPPSDGSAVVAQLQSLGVLDPTTTASGTSPSEKSPDSTPTNASESSTGISPTSSSDSSSG